MSETESERMREKERERERERETERERERERAPGTRWAHRSSSGICPTAAAAAAPSRSAPAMYSEIP